MKESKQKFVGFSKKLSYQDLASGDIEVTFKPTKVTTRPAFFRAELAEQSFTIQVDTLAKLREPPDNHPYSYIIKAIDKYFELRLTGKRAKFSPLRDSLKRYYKLLLAIELLKKLLAPEFLAKDQEAQHKDIITFLKGKCEELKIGIKDYLMQGELYKRVIDRLPPDVKTELLKEPVEIIGYNSLVY